MKTTTAQSAGNFLSREVTIVLADLRGFTSISESRPPSAVLELLNRYLGRMSEIIFRHEGTIDKFMGDSIMVLFGAPLAHEDDVRRALVCAVEMQLASGSGSTFRSSDTRRRTCMPKCSNPGARAHARCRRSNSLR